MLLSKFSFLIFLIPFNVYAFTDMECLHSKFEVSVSHKGKPFGLTKNTISIKKDDCIINVSHEKLKFMKGSWKIDVCREPIHIKKTGNGVEVVKKTANCSKGSDAFCGELERITTNIQDDGLIFAEGEKESLTSDHGKIYCSYLLLKSYMERDIVFNRQKKYENILDPSFAPKKVVPAEVVSPEKTGVEVEVIQKSSGSMPMDDGADVKTSVETGAGESTDPASSSTGSF